MRGETLSAIDIKVFQQAEGNRKAEFDGGRALNDHNGDGKPIGFENLSTVFQNAKQNSFRIDVEKMLNNTNGHRNLPRDVIKRFGYNI